MGTPEHKSLYSERSIARAELFLEDLFYEQDQTNEKKWLSPTEVANAMGGPLPAVFREALTRLVHRGKMILVRHASGTIHYRLRRAQLSAV